MSYNKNSFNPNLNGEGTLETEQKHIMAQMEQVLLLKNL